MQLRVADYSNSRGCEITVGGIVLGEIPEHLIVGVAVDGVKVAFTFVDPVQADGFESVHSLALLTKIRIFGDITHVGNGKHLVFAVGYLESQSG